MDNPVLFQDKQIIGQLDKRKGGYFYLVIPADVVSTFKQKRSTRLLCTLDGRLTFQCGLNHLGDGNFFIILSTKNLKSIEKSLGDSVAFLLQEDPNPLGVDMPEVLNAVLEQHENLRQIFDDLTLGKKRNVIHSMNKLKDIDHQIEKTIQLILDSNKPRSKKTP